MGRLLLLFIAVPAIELMLLIEIGGHIGTLATVGVIVVTGIAGASLARRQGLGVLRQLQREIEQGRLPAQSLADGAFILVAAALLVTPGILTDAVGFLCLVPVTRNWGQRVVRRWLERAVREQRIQMDIYSGHFSGDSGPILDVTPSESKDANEPSQRP